MKKINQLICVSHLLSMIFSVYLAVYAVQETFEVENLFFPLSIIDYFLISVIFFLVLFIGSMFGGVASFLRFSIYPLLTLILGIIGIVALFLFPQWYLRPALLLFGSVSFFQFLSSSWLFFQHINLIKLGDSK
ncbi:MULTISPECIES: hypothetical protein [Enterococcus]|uniref:Uncharacterized protein n=2 Tax=Enterococcus thailandicus TaxID=417368 RepID=A0A179EP71_ENTTH|nr:MULTISPECIES: hypothetical protein [Enterococcus]ASZ07220.1 hypothetical protein CK496_04630 [Enterococcus thailandicus]MDA3974563.1 hypothetical protein [Enterococcus thailandicus]MDA3977049.1 hypothetical protein [Enterococcus thailandicus]MDA3982015.1 hypothetical protein [Enterococcus thailandicus]MDK4351411.1 hypothetical protein [Enterococcus thailandicus]